MLRRYSAPLMVTFGVLSLAALGSGCGDEPEYDGTGCSLAAQTGCAPNLVCEEVDDGTTACFEPVLFQGKVFDSLSSKPIAGAHVVARDANDAVVSSVAISSADGNYSLRVPAKRTKEGAIIGVKYTLRADAMAYATFPKVPRVGIPIDVADATGAPPVVKSAATDIALIPLPDASGFGSVSGKVFAKNPGGTLVVAGGSTGVADLNGDYVVFNVPPGSVEVRGYAAGYNLDSASATVVTGKDTGGVNLADNGKPTSRISGKISIVNGGGSSTTSVILALEDTFDPVAARGEAPKGLRVGGVSGDFAIDAVPDGKYVVLAAFENDGLVRDPDTSIGGTEIVHIDVAGGDQVLDQSFKVTGALAVASPGASEIEVVSGTPTLVWEDDSSEDNYELRIFDALGDKVFEDLAVPSVSGGDTVTYSYAGPALTPGMIYQFRVLSIKDATPISATEDLKGVFLYK